MLKWIGDGVLALALIVGAWTVLHALFKGILEQLIQQQALAQTYKDSQNQHDTLTLENQKLADQTRVASGTISEEEVERKRLEAEEPGITKVNWGPDGSVLLDESLLDEYSRANRSS